MHLCVLSSETRLCLHGHRNAFFCFYFIALQRFRLILLCLCLRVFSIFFGLCVQVFPVRHLQVYSAEELELRIRGDVEAWDLDTLRARCVCVCV